MSEYVRHARTFWENGEAVRYTFGEAIHFGRVTVTVRWNSIGRREWARALAQLADIESREVQSFGSPIPRAIAFSVSGSLHSIEQLTARDCVESVEYKECAVPFTGTGTAEEKQKTRVSEYTPHERVRAMAK